MLCIDPNKCHIVRILSQFFSSNENCDAKMIICTNRESNHDRIICQNILIPISLCPTRSKICKAAGHTRPSKSVAKVTLRGLNRARVHFITYQRNTLFVDEGMCLFHLQKYYSLALSQVFSYCSSNHERNAPVSQRSMHAISQCLL